MVKKKKKKKKKKRLLSVTGCSLTYLILAVCVFISSHKSVVDIEMKCQSSKIKQTKSINKR